MTGPERSHRRTAPTGTPRVRAPNSASAASGPTTQATNVASQRAVVNSASGLAHPVRAMIAAVIAPARPLDRRARRLATHHTTPNSASAGSSRSRWQDESGRRMASRPPVHRRMATSRATPAPEQQDHDQHQRQRQHHRVRFRRRQQRPVQSGEHVQRDGEPQRDPEHPANSSRAHRRPATVRVKGSDEAWTSGTYIGDDGGRCGAERALGDDLQQVDESARPFSSVSRKNAEWSSRNSCCDTRAHGASCGRAGRSRAIGQGLGAGRNRILDQQVAPVAAAGHGEPHGDDVAGLQRTGDRARRGRRCCPSRASTRAWRTPA